MLRNTHSVSSNTHPICFTADPYPIKVSPGWLSPPVQTLRFSTEFSRGLPQGGTCYVIPTQSLFFYMAVNCWVHLKYTIIWSTSWENLFMSYANNKGADQPAHPRSLISAIVVSCLDSIIPLLAKAKISRPYLVPVAEQACLSLIWSKTPKTGFLMTWLI